MGFVFNVRKKYDYDTVKCGMNSYRGLYGNACVPAKYQIDEGRNWGMFLGRYVRRIRADVLWPEHAENFFE